MTALPARVGPYRVEALLAEGGMGVLYRATSPSGEAVAVKVLRGALVVPDLVRRFQREARLRIEHPNVVRVVDAGADEQGTPYLALELLRGESLRQRLDRGPLAPREVVDVGVQACRGLSAAHALGVVHRDIKPSNLFVCEQGVVKVLDFGIALDGDATRLTRSGGVPGTIGYLSPEQAEGRPALDARSDVWALGAVLYESIAGAPPFAHESPVASVVATLLGELPPLASRAPDVPPGLAAVVERALARDPGARYADTEAFARALAGADLSPRAASDATSPSATTRSMRPGERRVIAVLLAEGVRDAAAIERAVEAERGIALRLVGDRAVGLFGAETWEGDEVDRALHVARSIRGDVARAAVASGWAASAGDRIVGEALEAAERGCAAAVAGVAIDREAARALRSSASLVAVDDRLFEAPVASAPAEPSTAALGPPIVGREAELAQLDVAVRRARDDRRASIAWISGPLGAGKTRLRSELEQTLASSSDAARVVVTSAVAAQRDTGWSVIRAIVKTLIAKPAAGSPVDALKSLVRGAVADEARAKQHAETLAELLGVRALDDDASGDVGRMADRVRLATLDLLEGLTARAMLTLVVDDAQWADDASLELLEELADRAIERPLLIVIVARSELSERRRDLFSGRDAVHVETRGLGRADTAALARSVAGRDIGDALVRAIVDRTGGNPLFVVQIVRALADEGRLGDDPSELPLPVSVEAAVQSRLDQLSPAEKELCKRASIWGRPFSLAELRALGANDAERIVPALVARDLIHGRGPRDARVHQLRSSLVADVAYRMLPDEVRADLHLEAARHLDAQPDADPEETARHYEAAGQKAPAARAHAVAARRAVRRGDTAAALRGSARALALGVDPETRFALHALRVDALRFVGDRAALEAELALALAHATTPGERARARSEQSVFLARSGRTDEAIAEASRAVLDAREAGDDETIALARGREALALAQAGRLADAREALAEARARSAASGAALRALVTGWRAHLAAIGGDLGERIAATRELVAVHEELGDRRRAAGAEANLADAYNRLGDHARAEAALRGAIAGCREIGNRLMEGYAELNLGYALARLARPDEAIEALDAAARIAAASGEARLASLVLVYRARAFLIGGRTDEAATEAARAADVASQRAMRDLEATALATRAAALLAQGDGDGAVEAATRSLALRDELGGIEEDESDIFAIAARALRAAARTEDAQAVERRGRRRVEEIAAGISDADLRAAWIRAQVAALEA